MVKCAAESTTYLGGIHTEHVFAFHCTAFPLFFYNNMHFVDVFDQIKSKLKVS